MGLVAIRRALLSVSDKTGLVDLGLGLARYRVELLASGGTFLTLRNAGVAVAEISDYTGFPELLDGRVKTLHPKVHAGILCRRDNPAHVDALSAHGVVPIDLVVVNLYPFEQTVARGDVSDADAVEEIDIGGPALLRAAAKNHAHVAVLSDPAQYADFLAVLEKHGGNVTAEVRRRLAAAAFGRTAQYDRAIYDFFRRESRVAGDEADRDPDFPDEVSLTYRLTTPLRYGENPHQKAALYVDTGWTSASVVTAKQRHGKQLSYNNLLDLDSALAIVREFSRPAVVVIKHNNPCGAATADRLADAFLHAWAGDPVSAFGSVLGLNRPLDRDTALGLCEPGRFVEAIIAPAFDDDAFEILTTRPSWKANVRLLDVGDLTVGAEQRRRMMQMRPLEGGCLRQSPDADGCGLDDANVVTATKPTGEQLRDLSFAWVISKHVKSNAIVLAKNEAVIGVGAGQMSRIDATRIAIEKAGARVQDSALASDAFFPFRDNVDLAARAGVKAIVQPGGSKRDNESIDACNEHRIAMLFTGRRHFKH
jgi:phosphoribosylaminoimidazolecarboxamide formyltransferase/IMP cyclohydrolase